MRKLKVIFGWCLLVTVAVNWPLSLFTYASSEPPIVLSLSWAALFIESITLITTAQVHKDQGEEKK